VYAHAQQYDLCKEKNMVNKDYILRLAERFGRMLAIVLHLRQYNQHEEALIAIDEALYQATGLTLGFINAASEETLLALLSPLGTLNIEKCLWIALLLKEEGAIYDELGKQDEAYFRYLKSLNLFLIVMLDIHEITEMDVAAIIDELVEHLDEYELPEQTKMRLFRYEEMLGNYATVEDMLFELLDNDAQTGDAASVIIEQGTAFYLRLLRKTDADLQAGNFTKAEAEEGLTQLRNRITPKLPYYSLDRSPEID
jgi:hypothetical protein